MVFPVPAAPTTSSRGRPEATTAETAACATSNSPRRAAGNGHGWWSGVRRLSAQFRICSSWSRMAGVVRARSVAASLIGRPSRRRGIPSGTGRDMSTQRVAATWSARHSSQGVSCSGSTVMVVGSWAASSRTSSAGRHVDCRSVSESSACSTNWATAAESRPTRRRCRPMHSGKETVGLEPEALEARVPPLVKPVWGVAVGFGGSAVQHRLPLQPPPLPPRRRSAQGGLKPLELVLEAACDLAGPLREMIQHRRWQCRRSRRCRSPAAASATPRVRVSWERRLAW